MEDEAEKRGRRTHGATPASGRDFWHKYVLCRVVARNVHSRSRIVPSKGIETNGT